MIVEILPGAVDKAVAIAVCLIEGRWEDARRDFAEKMREALDADRRGYGPQTWQGFAVTGVLALIVIIISYVQRSRNP